MILDLAYYPRQWQRECHLNRKRFTVYVLHRRAGKTELALMELIEAALKTPLPLSNFFYVAPFLKQAKLIAWSRLKQRLRPLIAAGVVGLNEVELSVTFQHNGAVLRLYGADNPDAMRGVRLDGVVIDEVAQQRPEVWQDILQPALSDRMGWAIFIGTPGGVDAFSELYFRALEDRTNTWHAALYTVYDTESLNPDEVERLRQDMSETSFAREYLCDFSAAGEDQLISLSDVDAAARRTVRPEDYSFSPRILGIDPARFGNDNSVLAVRQGLLCASVKSFAGIDNMALAGRAAEIIEEQNIDAVFCDEGNGAGVIDRLRQLRYTVTGVHFGGKAAHAQYANMRTQIWCSMADWLRAGGTIPNRPRLRLDLATPTFSFTADGKKQLESKDAIKKRGLPSPDEGDALATTFAAPVAVRSAREVWFDEHRTTSKTGEYNPYADV